MIRFEHIELLYLLLGIPVFTLLFVAGLQLRKTRLKRLGDLNFLKRLMPDVSREKMILKFDTTMLDREIFGCKIFLTTGVSFAPK